MTTRLQELVQRLKISEPSDVIEGYLMFYVTKEKHFSETINNTALLSLLSQSLDTLKCCKWYEQNRQLDGIVKYEFLLHSDIKKHSSAAKVSSCSSKRKESVKEPLLASDILYNGDGWDMYR